VIFTLLSFLLALSVLIAIHEYGHYRTARACGIKVLRFSLGFGPVIWRYQRQAQDTEFVLSALPLGGYVQMVDTRQGPVVPADQPFAFDLKPLWQRTAVVAAGPLANLCLAVLLYTLVHWAGVQEPKARLGSPVASSLAEEAGLRSGDWVRSVSLNETDWQEVRSMTDLRWHITQAVLRDAALQLSVSDGAGRSQRKVRLALDTLGAKEIDAQVLRRIGLLSPYSEPRLGDVVPGGPAAKAGLRTADLVLQVDGVATADTEQLRNQIRAHGLPDAPPMVWMVERGGQRISLDVQPSSTLEEGQRIGRIQAVIGQLPEMVDVRYGAWEGFTQAVSRTWEMSALSLKMLGRMVVGQASLKNLSGPLTIADYAGQSARLGLSYYLGFLAVISVSLGVLNLLPLPMLDGGHLVFFAFEALTGHPPSPAWLERMQRGGMALMGLMMALAIYNDLVRYLGV
jgi:regulator of sigma E protease